MFSKKEQIALAITGVEAVVIGVGAALCWGKRCYHKGRIDACNDIQKGFEKMLEYKSESDCDTEENRS